MIKYILAGALCLLASCANNTNPVVAAAIAPSTIEAAIVAIGSPLSSKVSPAAKSVIHQVAEDLLALDTASVTPDAVNAILAKLVTVPANDSAVASAIVTYAVGELNYALAKFGSHNKTTLVYVQDIANGLLAAGF